MDQTQPIALQATSQAEGRISKTALYYVSFIALGMSLGSIGPTLPGLADHTRTHLSEISFLFTARSGGYLLGSLLVGRLYDRQRGHLILALGLTLMVIMLMLVPVIPLLGVLTAVLATLGFAESFVDVGGNTMLVWVHREKVAPFMNGLHFFFGVGAFLSPIIIAQLVLLSGDITWAYWALALLTVPVIFLALRQPSPSSVPASAHPAGGRVNYTLVALVVVFFFLYASTEAGFSSWIFTYAVKSGLTDPTTAAYLTSTFWVTLTAGRLMSIPLSTRLSPRALLAIDLAGCLIFICLALLQPDSFPVILIATCGLGLSNSSIFPSTLSFAERHMHITGRVNSWFFAGSSAGSMFVPWLIGQLFDPFGPHVVIQVVALGLALSVAVFVALVVYTNRHVAQRKTVQYPEVGV